MRNAHGPSKAKGVGVRAEPGAVDHRAVKKRVVEQLRALTTSLVASGSIVDARHSPLETEPPPRRARRLSRGK